MANSCSAFIRFSHVTLMRLNMRALITGANGGIGSAITHKLLQNKYYVTALDQETALLEQMDKPTSALALTNINLANCDIVAAYAATILQPYDVFIHAAGVREIKSPL